MHEEPTDEEDKAAAMRLRNEARVGRLLDAKARTMGIDVAALDAQVEEKKLRKAREEEEDRAYVEYEQRMAEVVALREDLALQRRRGAMNALTTDWANTKKKEERSIDYVGLTLPNEPRPLLFAKQPPPKPQEPDDFDFQIARQRDAIEARECDARAARVASLAAENAQYARLQQAKHQTIQGTVRDIERLEIAKKLQDPALCETTSLARSSVANHRYRPDHFKGFSNEERKAVLNANARIVDAKHQARLDESRFKQDHDLALLASIHAANQASDVVADEKRQAALRLAAEYSERAKQDKAAKLKAHKDHFGAVDLDAGYMSGFGCSAR